MPELGFVVFLIAIAYGMGTVWYTLLGRDYASWMRMAAFPFVGAIVGEELVNAGPSLIPSQKGLLEMNPGVRRGLEGRRPRDAGCWAHRTICRAQDKRDPVAVPLPWLRAPGGSCGAAPS